MKLSKITTIISLSLIFLIGLAVLGYSWNLTKSQDLIWQGSIIHNPNLEPEPIDSEINTSDWVIFDSQKDTGIKFYFSFKHPVSWFQNGSIDGGAASSILFYEKDKYKKSCNPATKGVIVCYETGKVARVSIFGPSIIPAKVEYDNESRREIIVDGYKGTEIIGFIKPEIGDSNLYNIGKPGEKETRIVLPNVNGIRFEFCMIIKNKNSEYIYNEILKTIKFWR